MGYPKFSLDEVLAESDLSQITRAVAREHVIRDVMATSGESREIVSEMIDAALSMGDEAVLDLTDGQPTSLRDALSRYVDELEKRDELQSRDQITEELTAICNYPYPGVPELEIQEQDDRDLCIVLSGREVYRASWEDAGWGGLNAVTSAVKAVYDEIKGSVR